MDPYSIFFLTIVIFVVALLYSSVGHGGASSYLAAMALFGIAPEEMKPAALVLNILVASISTTKYIRAGRFSWPLFWPFALVSVPFAFIGGFFTLPAVYYKPVIGIVLIVAAYHFVRNARQAEYGIKPPVLPLLVLSGAGLGFFSGLMGVGGGIFLSPLLIFLQWAPVRHVSGIAAAFILVNSIAGLLGFSASAAPHFPQGLTLWALAAMFGSYIGASYGSGHLASPAIKRLLALVLLLAGGKMILAAGG